MKTFPKTISFSLSLFTIHKHITFSPYQRRRLSLPFTRISSSVFDLSSHRILLSHTIALGSNRLSVWPHCMCISNLFCGFELPLTGGSQPSISSRRALSLLPLSVSSLFARTPRCQSIQVIKALIVICRRTFPIVIDNGIRNYWSISAASRLLSDKQQSARAFSWASGLCK